MPHNTFDNEALARIVAAAGYALDKINLGALREQLLFCEDCYKIADSPSEYARARGKAKRARDMIRKLVSVLQDDIFPEPWLLLVPLEAYYNRIDPKKLEITAKEFAKNTKKLVRITSSPTWGLVGSWLPQVYRDIFGQPATSYEPTDGGPPATRYVRFACQVAKEMGINKCSPYTVDKALAHYRQLAESKKRQQGKTKKKNSPLSPLDS